MEIVIIVLVLALLGAGVGLWTLMRRLGEARTHRAVADERVRAAEARMVAAEADFKQRLADRDRAAEDRMAAAEADFQQRLADRDRAAEDRIAEMRNAMGDNFRVIADQTLDATARRQEQRAREGLEAVLGPMRQAFEKMSADFARRAVDDTAERSTLRQAIETLRNLNRQVSDETRRLTSALKGNTGFQGRWGEMVLANILEGSGLEPGRWLVYQESTNTEDGGRLRPDAVIHCPRNRDIIIDSKVSLTSYLRMTECDDETTRATLLAEHLRSVENHLRGLSNKEYQRHVGAEDAGFVLMFVPHEGAYLAAMQADPDLWQRAYDRHVVIVSPTHLITVVRLVEQMWQTEDRTANSIAIATEATKMLDQLNDFMADLKSVGTALDRAQAAYESAGKRLATGRGNVLRRAERLRDLGIKTRKPLPPATDE